jgi:glycerol kinase
MDGLILSIDQGTTGTTVALFDSRCQVLSKHKTEFKQIFPQPGWVEHDLEDIWASVLKAMASCLERSRKNPNDIRAIGITNQRETTALWDRKTGKPLHHAIVWQCRRTTPLCEELKKAGHEKLFRQRTGLVLDPYFSGTKLRWLLDTVSGLRSRANAGMVCFGTIDSFLVSRLTNQRAHITDVSNASRTLLFNLNTLAWDTDLLTILDIPAALLPEVRSSSEHYGVTQKVPGLPDGIPICGMAGDQQAALFGQTCFEPGQTKCTYGTGAFLLLNTGTQPVISNRGLLTTVGWKLGTTVTYVLEGSVFIAGAAVQWLRDGLRIIRSSAEIEALAASVSSSDGVMFVPALVGLGAPYWNPNARGVITGLTRGTTSAHIARAALEGIAFQVRDVVVTLQEESGSLVPFLRVDGGAAENNLLLQFQADILGIEIHRPKVVDTTALGAALLAGLGIGLWRDLDEIRNLWSLDRTFIPQLPADQVQAQVTRWRAAVSKA